MDGVDCSVALRNGGASPVKDYYWAWQDNEVIRTDRWKLFHYIDRVELFDIRPDFVEAKNVADGNPDVVERLSARLAEWRKDLGIASPITPSNGAFEPKPEGDVLEVSVRQTAAVSLEDALAVQFAIRRHSVAIGDSIEFDVMVPRGGYRHGGFFVSPYRNGDPPVFDLGMGVDQTGRDSGERGGAGSGSVGSGSGA